MTRAFTKSVLMLAVLGIAAAAPLQAGTRESVREILRARHPIVMTAAEWQKLGADVDTHLLEAAADSGLTYGARQRALSALSVVGGPRAKEFLRDMVRNARVAPELLSTAVSEYARTFSKTDPTDVRIVTVPLLEHEDWTVRQGAVRALGELGSKEGFEAMRLRQTRETHPAVQSALRTALRPSDTEKH